MYTSHKPGVTPCACTTVKKLSRVLVRHYDAKIMPAGISITQLAVLRCFSRHDGDPLVRVAEELELDRTSLYRAINPMVRDGWIKLADGKDVRTRIAKVTQKGNTILARADKGWSEIQGSLIEKFGAKAYSRLIGELHRLADCVEAIQA